MKILLYNPDNGVTRNFMPHLWMFLLQSLTPKGHEVILIDGNAKAMTREELVRFCQDQEVGLVGIGAMTRMVARAYQVADALREAGIKVVMGGPHVTECPDEALGLDGGPRHADAVALGEADATWPLIVEDAANGCLKDRYQPEIDAKGNDIKPGLQDYPHIPWETLDLEQFSLVPKFLKPVLSRLGTGWGKFFVVPIETGRGCPYGCEFCTVTGFFGDSIRFRTNESVVEELLRLKERARKEKGQVAVFFIDDNLAINKKPQIIAARSSQPVLRCPGSLRSVLIFWLMKNWSTLSRIWRPLDIHRHGVDRSGNMADVNKTFSKPANYGAVLQGLARRDIYAITSFIFSMDNDTVGVGGRTVDAIESWPPGLPVFGQLTPFPATPLYERLQKAGRLDRPKHWQDFAQFVMAHKPAKMTIEEARTETISAWSRSYSPERNRAAIESISDSPIQTRISHLVARMFFRGIYFPQMGTAAWVKLLFQNRSTIMGIAREGFSTWRAHKRTHSGKAAIPETT